MSDYSYPYKDAEFVFNELVGFDQLCEHAGLDEVNTELAFAVLEEANRMGTEVIAPLNVVADREGVDQLILAWNRRRQVDIFL